MCQGRAVSELLAIFCCNLDDEPLIDSLLGLLFDVFNIQVQAEHLDHIELDENESEKMGIFEKLVKGANQLRDEDAMEFSLDRSFIVQEARHKMRNVFNEDNAELDGIFTRKMVQLQTKYRSVLEKFRKHLHYCHNWNLSCIPRDRI